MCADASDHHHPPRPGLAALHRRVSASPADRERRRDAARRPTRRRSDGRSARRQARRAVRRGAGRPRRRGQRRPPVPWHRVGARSIPSGRAPVGRVRTPVRQRAPRASPDALQRDARPVRSHHERGRQRGARRAPRGHARSVTAGGAHHRHLAKPSARRRHVPSQPPLTTRPPRRGSSRSAGRRRSTAHRPDRWRPPSEPPLPFPTGDNASSSPP